MGWNTAHVNPQASHHINPMTHSMSHPHLAGLELSLDHHNGALADLKGTQDSTHVSNDAAAANPFLHAHRWIQLQANRCIQWWLWYTVR